MSLDSGLDKSKIRRSFAAAADSYDDMAALQREVALKLLEKYPLERTTGMVLDVGCGTGFLTRQLPVDAARQSLLALDIALPMLQFSRQKNADLPACYVCADAEKLPLAEDSVQQIYSNLALQWCQDLEAVFRNFNRILQTGGQLVFATFGPETLRELKAAWAAVDEFTHVNEFYSADQIIDFLRKSGFEAPSANTVIYQSRYPSVMALMRELKGIGAHNVNLARNRKPTTRQQLQRMTTCYEGSSMEGAEVVATYEIIFVQARR
ncbi:MAG: malonyl-ACP O-methyltransferase BioC [Methylomonas sp.]